jgi:hypothetical protein
MIFMFSKGRKHMNTIVALDESECEAQLDKEVLFIDY